MNPIFLVFQIAPEKVFGVQISPHQVFGGLGFARTIFSTGAVRDHHLQKNGVPDLDGDFFCQLTRVEGTLTLDDCLDSKV